MFTPALRKALHDLDPSLGTTMCDPLVCNGHIVASLDVRHGKYTPAALRRSRAVDGQAVTITLDTSAVVSYFHGSKTSRLFGLLSCEIGILRLSHPSLIRSPCLPVAKAVIARGLTAHDGGWDRW